MPLACTCCCSRIHCPRHVPLLTMPVPPSPRFFPSSNCQERAQSLLYFLCGIVNKITQGNDKELSFVQNIWIVRLCIKSVRSSNMTEHNQKIQSYDVLIFQKKKKTYYRDILNIFFSTVYTSSLLHCTVYS